MFASGQPRKKSIDTKQRFSPPLRFESTSISSFCSIASKILPFTVLLMIISGSYLLVGIPHINGPGQ